MGTHEDVTFNLRFGVHHRKHKFALDKHVFGFDLGGANEEGLLFLHFFKLSLRLEHFVHFEG